MTFEEWKSEQYKDQSTEEKLEFVEHLHNFPQYFKKAFLAGLNAKTQWHDLRKDPNDLPKENTLVFSDKGMVVMWRDLSWLEYSPNYDNIKLRNWEKPIAWCELPKFEG